MHTAPPNRIADWQCTPERPRMTTIKIALSALFAGWAIAIVPATSFGVAQPPAAGQTSAGGLSVPWGFHMFIPEEGCQWRRAGIGLESVTHNPHYLGAPRPGEDWRKWLAGLQRYREAARTRWGDPSEAEIALRFDGVRAWIRTARQWALAADLADGETVRLRGEARWVEGNDTLCLAMDWCDRSHGHEGPWLGWSTVLGSTSIARDKAWHPFEIAVRVPAFDAANRWARPIVGMDGTFDRRPGSLVLRSLSLTMPGSPQRGKRLASIARSMPQRAAGLDDSVYRRADLAWMTRNFVCGFVMVYDRAFWNPERHEYRVGPLCDEAQREFGGFDSVVLWHAYPRIGADARNQFDFFRDMPGGLPDRKSVV